MKKSTSRNITAVIIAVGLIIVFQSVISKKEHVNKTVYKSTKTAKYKKDFRKTLKGGYFACISRDLFDEISLASANKDNLAIGHLLSEGCVLTKTGIPFSRIDTYWDGVVKIRAYVEDKSIVLYTNTENTYY